jgi:hypothetical protein
MPTHHRNIDASFESYELNAALWSKVRNVLAAVAILGWLASAAAFASGAARFEFSYLAAFVFWLSLALGALFFVMVQHVSGASWSVTMRRIAENAMITLPVAAVLFLPVLFALPALYVWARPAAVAADPILRERVAYLNPDFFTVRAAIYFAAWTFWAWKLYRNSIAQDAGRSLPLAQSAERWSAPGLVVFMITGAFAGIDWMMSLNPHWYSTMFGVYYLSGAALGFYSLLTVILLAFRRAGVLRYAVNEEHYHDLGKWIFALTIFWTYIAFSQYLLIWYGNMPEETIWYHNRETGGWHTIAGLLLFGQFLAPFALLLGRWAKRRLALLGAVAAWVVVVHYFDLYWVVMPAYSPSGPQFGWQDLAVLAATGGTLALAFWRGLKQHAIAPVGDIRFEKALEFENV